MPAFSKQPASNGELQSVVLQVELFVTESTNEAIERWGNVIEAVGSVAGQEVKVIDIGPIGRIVPLETQIEQHFRTQLDDFRLTPQEQKITELMLHGKTGREVAKAMGLAEGTIRNAMSNVLSKIGCSSRAGLAFRVLGIDIESS